MYARLTCPLWSAWYISSDSHLHVRVCLSSEIIVETFMHFAHLVSYGSYSEKQTSAGEQKKSILLQGNKKQQE